MDMAPLTSSLSECTCHDSRGSAFGLALAAELGLVLPARGKLP